MKTDEKKSFDCIELKRKSALDLYERTKDMSIEQELEYWRMRDEAALRQIKEARKDAATPSQ